MKLNNPNVEVPDEYKCPLSLELMEHPVIASDGHTYEKEMIEHHLRQNNTSPMTREVLRDTHVVTNWNLKKAIESFVEKSNKDYEQKLKAKENRDVRRAVVESLESYQQRRSMLEAEQITRVLKQVSLGAPARDASAPKAARASAASDPHFEAAKALADSAKLLRQEGKYSDAIKLSEQALKLAPNNTFILNGYADGLSRGARYRDAIKIYDKVLSLKPDDSFAQKGKAIALKFQSRQAASAFSAAGPALFNAERQGEAAAQKPRAFSKR